MSILRDASDGRPFLCLQVTYTDTNNLPDMYIVKLNRFTGAPVAPLCALRRRPNLAHLHARNCTAGML